MLNIRKFLTAIGIVPVSSTGISAKGELEVLATGGKLNYHDGSSASPVVTESSTATLTNKTLTSPVINSPTGITKSDVGLSNVDNTSDATKNSASVSLTNHTIDASLNTISNIVDANIGAGAAIVDTKLATISTAGKVSNSATTAISANTASAIVARDASGNFTAGTITAALSGNATTATTAGNVSGTVAIANGGTGQTSKAAAFDALQPMTTGGDIIYGGASGTGTRLANGSNGQVLTSSGGTSAPTWTSATASPTSSLELYNLGIATSVSANALTIALKQGDGSTDPASGTGAVKVGFRNPTSTTGGYSEVSITGALSLVVSSGSTLGTASGVAKYLYIYLINNAGTAVLGIAGTQFDEGSVQSSTAEGGAGAADSVNVIYSTAAQTSKAIRLIGRINVNEATAGTWASNATEVSIIPFDPKQMVAASFTTVSTLSITSGNVVNFDSTVYDSHNSYSGGTYTIPVSGYYIFSLTVPTTVNAANLYLVRGSTAIGRIVSVQTGGVLTPGTIAVKCNSGDTMAIYSGSNSTLDFTTPSGTTTGLRSFWSINQVGTF